jgi:hypothetical protein
MGRACITREGEVRTGFLWENQKEGDHEEDLDIGGRIILKFVLE